jgi:hypothetical protein
MTLSPPSHTVTAQSGGNAGITTTAEQDVRKSWPLTMTIERVMTDQVTTAMYATYTSAFGPLQTKAAARHLLGEDEFAAEMKDPSIDKYTVWDDYHRPIALTTLTTNLAAIPWVSREYYASRYPEAAAQGTLFYLGYILVERAYRRSNALIMMTHQVNRRLHESHGVLGFDMCGFNDRSGIGRHAKKLLASSDQIELLDVQSYYAADYRTPRISTHRSDVA